MAQIFIRLYILNMYICMYVCKHISKWLSGEIRYEIFACNLLVGIQCTYLIIKQSYWWPHTYPHMYIHTIRCCIYKWQSSTTLFIYDYFITSMRVRANCGPKYECSFVDTQTHTYMYIYINAS